MTACIIVELLLQALFGVVGILLAAAITIWRDPYLKWSDLWDFFKGK